MNPTISPEELAIPEHLDPDRLRSARLAATKHFMDFLMGETLGRIVDRDTEARVGNGAIPVPDWTQTIQQLALCGYTVNEIIRAVAALEGSVSRRQVMEVLDEHYTCEGCEEFRDIEQGEDGEYCPEGDLSKSGWVTKCCHRAFMSRGDNPYPGESPMRERAE